MKYLKKTYYTDSAHGLTRILFAGIIVVVLVWASTFLWNAFNLYSHEDFNGGTLGDSFGMVNALFTSLAFALLIYTSLMQREELKLQRKELEENRAELKRSADAHKELVKLSIEQLKLTKELNKDSLSPRLQIDIFKKVGSMKFRLQLILKRGEIKIINIKSSSFKTLNQQDIIETTLKDLELINFDLIRERKISDNMNIVIYFLNSGNKYSQRVSINKQLIATITSPAYLGSS